MQKEGIVRCNLFRFLHGNQLPWDYNETQKYKGVDPMRKIRIAQIGIGHDHAVEILNSLRKQTDLFEVVGYAVPGREKTHFPRSLAQCEGLPELTVEEILNDPTIEAVSVETEELRLTEYARMAALHGKHIHMDKPGSPDLEAFSALIDAAKHSGKVFHLGYMYRYNPEIQAAMEQVRSGALGEIFAVEAQMNCLHIPQKRQWLQDFPGGMLFFLGCHLIDLIYGIQGEPQQILPLSCCTGLDGVTAQDYGMAVFVYPNGVSFAKSCAAERGGFARRQLVITGSKGSIELKPLEMFATDPPKSELYTDVVTCTGTNWEDRGLRRKSVVYDRYDKMMASFAAMCRGEIQNPWDYDYELSLFRVIMKACGA